MASKGDQLGVDAQPSPARKRRGPHILSTLLFLTALGFAAVAGYLYWNEQETEKNDPTPPPAVSGQWGLAQVKNQFDMAGFSTEIGRTNGDSDQIPGVPGQAITVEGNEIYIYIFSATREEKDPIVLAEQAFGKIDESTLKLTRQSSGDEIGDGEELHVFQGGNIIAVLVGGDPDDVNAAREIIEGLT